ncbi:PepSY domain-containing protein [Azospirillum sp. YIM B02556]|uniref:PepSY domain-containing protein n=1 Tax=Azospirillum endophyticum TaxID=2800326 RepID=A0ABS1F229_9PROT|nr:PepSY domain-containing protein [Azospirillum endophyticum]MBK1837474.1 PepSY domain-containing protein [Azospirillum endophyticum]
MRTASALLLPVILLLGAGPGARAGDDHERARTALREGRILPLERIVESARRQFGGEVLDVDLEGEDGGKEDGFRYELKLIAPDGRILKLDYDAASGELLRVKGRHRSRDGGR